MFEITWTMLQHNKKSTGNINLNKNWNTKKFFFTDFKFPCQGRIKSIDYYRINYKKTGKIGIWRSLSNNTYNLTYYLVYLINLPKDGNGLKTLQLQDYITVYPGDAISISTVKNGKQPISFKTL